jgi:NAD(P)-dependent dehydrogenase (short-subunit alcohol dehydrogenase family)
MSTPIARRLEGEAAIVTGAGAGIGRASAELFARHGAKVVCADLDEAAAKRVAAAIAEAGGTAIAVQADVRRWADAERMVDVALADFHGIDILFNNAGTGIRGKVHELAEADWDLVLETNLKSVYLCSKAIIPHFLARGSGKIVNNASSFGLLASPDYPAYCASKGGVIMLTKQMALDYGPQIRVNCICPGATDTPRLRRGIAASPDPVQRRKSLEQLNIGLNRLAEPMEIAQAVLFLASNESSFCTGTALVVDGGQTSDA